MEELEKLGHELRHLDEIFDRKKRLMNEIAVKTQEGKISPAKPGFQEDETVQKLNELEEKHPVALWSVRSV